MRCIALVCPIRALYDAQAPCPVSLIGVCAVQWPVWPFRPLGYDMRRIQLVLAHSVLSVVVIISQVWGSPNADAPGSDALTNEIAVANSRGNLLLLRLAVRNVPAALAVRNVIVALVTQGVFPWSSYECAISRSPEGGCSCRLLEKD